MQPWAEGAVGAALRGAAAKGAKKKKKTKK